MIASACVAPSLGAFLAFTGSFALVSLAIGLATFALFTFSFTLELFDKSALGNGVSFIFAKLAGDVQLVDRPVLVFFALPFRFYRLLIRPVLHSAQVDYLFSFARVSILSS